MAKNREWSVQYLNQQYSAMRWLARQGLTPAEIREMRWGQVDEFKHNINLREKIVSISYNLESDQICRKEYVHPTCLSYSDSGQEWFFEKSGIYCAWMFTAHKPKSWRKEKSREALFPLEAVEKACRDLQIPTISPLTFLDECANIEVSKLNIQNLETMEHIEEAELIAEANEIKRSAFSLNP